MAYKCFILFCLLAVGSSQATPVLSGSYRKDFYLPKYREALKTYQVPTDGGRVHLILQNSTCKGTSINSVKINSVEAMNLQDDDFTYFDWSRFHFDNTSNVYWISFHSRNKQWLDSSPKPVLSLAVSDEQGSNCYSGNVTLNVKPDILVTYATTRKGGKEFVVHFDIVSHRSHHRCIYH